MEQQNATTIARNPTKLKSRSVHILLVLATLLGVSDMRGLVVIAAQSPARAKAKSNNLYIVQMNEVPVASYSGGTPGLRPTKPGRGQKIDRNSPDVLAYSAYLNNRHSQMLGSVGAIRRVYDYNYTFNGFAAELSPGQAAALAKANGVLNVTKDELQTTTTSSTPTFLGLDAPGGLWDQLGGVGSAGDDIIIGVIDSGVWPESLSFSDRTDQNGNPSKDGKLSYGQIPPRWHGKCVPGEHFNASMFNQKLIGAQHFDAAWGGDAGLKEVHPWEFASPRDLNGHGTHTASTAGGNFGVPTTGVASAMGPIKGIAPRARIAVYKALYSTQDLLDTRGFNSDLLAAVDQAVADGVDVINYSVGGTQTNFLEPVQIAFLFAAEANVFVDAGAGNNGPTAGTVNHPAPWVTTVGAGTHNRNGAGSVTLGNNATYSGASLAPSVGPAPFIDSTAAGLPGADPAAVALCFSVFDTPDGKPVLDPAKVAGKIVLCDRGVNNRAIKSYAVREAGGVGMVLVNTGPGSLNADFNLVPTVHVADDQRAALKTYAASPNATAKINQATIVLNVPAPFMADFSSRGPLRAGGGDLLKPDLIAPGQGILAAVAPPGNFGESFSVYDGTSMSTPHIAGLAALLKNLHPDWTPMMIKSALMTSASDVLDGPDTDPVVIFSQGAGHVQPNRAADPGLVYNAGVNDWLAFLCGTTTGVNPSVCSGLSSSGYSLDPSDLNVASIAIGDLLGGQTVTRKVTNVGLAAATYNVSISGMTGFMVAVTPSSLTITPGETKSYAVTITRTSAPINEYTGGQLTWTDGSHNVRIPMVVRPLSVVAPTEVTGSGGPINYNVKFGYTGAFGAVAQGMIPAVQTNGSVSDDPTDSFKPAGPGVTAIPVIIPPGTTYARFSLFDETVAPASDTDLYVYRGTTLVGFSTGITSNEQVDLLNPQAGGYTVYVHGLNVSSTASFTLFHWLLGSASAGNMTISAPAATQSATGTIGVTFSGLAPNTKYLGSVGYSGIAGLPNPTIVRVDTQ
jgi:hypothetical protein